MVWAYVVHKYVSLRLCVFLCYVCTLVIPSNPSFENDVGMDSPLNATPLIQIATCYSSLLLPLGLCTGKGQR